MAGKYVLGFDVGGTKVGIGLASPDGKIQGSALLPNKDTDPDDVLPQMLASARKLLADATLKESDLAAFGISAPFPADPVNGILTAPTNNPKWRNVPIRKYFEDNLRIPGTFENDANCAALAEWLFGAGRGTENMIFLTMSTGIGAGIIAGGQLVRGKSFYAGEVGHMILVPGGRLCSCGLRGCYEAYCGGRAAAMAIQEELKDQPDHPFLAFADGQLEKIDMIAIEKAVRAGNQYALAIWDDMARKNAQAIGILMQTFNPEKIVLGTFGWAIGDLYMDPIRKYLKDFVWNQMDQDCQIVAGELKREIGSYAGAAAALNFLKEQR